MSPVTREASSRSQPVDDIAGADASLDGFLDGRIRALQPKSGPRAAIDALLLAAAVPARAGAAEQVLEAGLGAGVASLALAARVGDVRITGIEIQPQLCALARENARLNGVEQRLAVVNADLSGPHADLVSAGLAPETYDHGIANPPFFAHGRTRGSMDDSKAKAHFAEARTPDRWLRFLAAMAAPGGTVTLIHRPAALDELLNGLNGRFGGLVLFPLFPRDGAPAHRILVQGRKGSRAPSELRQGMILHEADGRYTEAAEAVFRDARGLELRATDARYDTG